MSIARNCPYSDSEENCRYEIFAWQPRLNKCSTCEKFLKKRFPDIDTSKFNIDENGNVLRDNGRMTDNTLDKIKELEEQNQSLAKRVCELQSDLAKKKSKNEKITERLEKEKCELLGIIQGKDKVIQELEKENAELKEQVENRNCSNCRRSKTGCPNDGSCHNFSLWQPFINPELTKAKEIIKKFLEFVNNEVEVEFDSEHPQEHTDLWNELCEKAEQFIKE